MHNLTRIEGRLLRVCQTQERETKFRSEKRKEYAWHPNSERLNREALFGS